MKDKSKNKTSRQTKEFKILPYFKQEWKVIIVYILLCVFGSALSLIYSVYTAKSLASVTEGTYERAIRLFLFVAVGNIIMTITYGITNYIFKKYSIKIKNRMRVDIAKQAFKLTDEAYTINSTAYFTKRISQDPGTMLDYIVQISDIIIAFIESLVMIIYISTLNIYIGLIGLLLMANIMIFETIRKKLRKKNRAKLLTLEEKSSSLMNEIIRSEKDIKSLNLENSLTDEISNRINATSSQDFKTFITDSFLMRGRRIFAICILSSMYVLMLFMLKNSLAFMTLGTFMIVYTNQMYFQMFGNNISSLMDIYNEVGLARDRINELYKNDECKLEKFGNIHLENIKGEIEFKNVDFSYTAYKEKSKEEILQERKYNKQHHIKEKIKTKVPKGKVKVLNNISFKIEPNTTVAFVGVSGSGKSTILNLVSKINTTNKGKILIDGVDINKLDKETIRSTISLVNQFPYIFDMTIKENLLLAKPDATDKEITEAIKDSALDEFVAGLKDGIDTKVGESGIKLSGGQKQRLAIARAMLRKSSIIIFDESTSSLDNIAQNQVKKSIDNIKGKSTVLIVAHRLTTIKNVDKIFFLENGKITDSGTFEELFNNNENFKKIFMAENIE